MDNVRSDESRFLLQYLDGRVRIQHTQRKIMDQSWLLSTVHAAGGCIMYGCYLWTFY